MKKLFVYALLGAVLSVPARANTIDPLHGFCVDCTSNGTNLSLNGDGTFGWLSSPPGLTGTMSIEFLIPNDTNLATFVMPGVSGFAAGIPALFSSTAWTSSDLTIYLGITASPPNPLSSFLTATNTVDPAATGYFDFRLLGIDISKGLLGPGSTPNDLFTLSAGLPIGSVITAFVVTCGEACDTTSTAQSESLLVNAPTVVPIPAAMWLFGTGMIGLVTLSRRKRTV